MTMLMCNELRTRSRELHDAYEDASYAHTQAVRNYAYGNGTFKQQMETLEACNAIWRELLKLHDLTERDWALANDSARRHYWGH